MVHVHMDGQSRGKRTPAMRITKYRRREIERLAKGLAEIAPATSPQKDSFCVRHIAAKHGLASLWTDGRNKQTMISEFLVKLFRKHKRKPKSVVLDIVTGGVQWMARRGRQVTKEQLNAIIEPMEALGLSIGCEVFSANIPDPSRVCEPRQDIVTLINRLDLHKALCDDCVEMFRDGHFNECVRKALERFEKRVQDILCDHKTFGRELMAKAFNENNALIALNEMKTANDRSEQEGFKFLTMGAMSGMRNLYSHGDVPQMSAMDALERLVFVSMLFKRVDQSVSGDGIG